MLTLFKSSFSSTRELNSSSSTIVLCSIICFFDKIFIFSFNLFILLFLFFISSFSDLFSNQDYDITTQPIQKNKLLELDQTNEKLIINITEPKQEKKGGLFSKSIYSYRIITPLIGKDVRRIYSDFEWLRDQFLLRYPLRLVPNIMKQNL